MSRTIKRVLVIDVEATCWEPPEPEYISEIIELGVTTLSLPSRKIDDNKSILIKPQLSTVSPFCTSLTGLTQELLDQEGLLFPDALQTFRKEYAPQKCMFASWGAYDQRILERNCELYDEQYPFGHNMHLNIKMLFAMQFGFTTDLQEAAEHLDLPWKGRPHRGSDDSLMAALILNELT